MSNLAVVEITNGTTISIMWKFLFLVKLLAFASSVSGNAIAGCGLGGGAFAVTGDGGACSASGNGVAFAGTGNVLCVTSAKPKCANRPAPKCGPNEEYIYTEYTDATCDAVPQKMRCGEYALRCKKGYVRCNGECIGSWLCPCGANEVYAWTWYTDGTCKAAAEKLSSEVLAYRCLPGFVRHEGACIDQCDCPRKCPGPNEVYKFTGHSDPTCNQEAQVLECPEYGCRCESGYVRNSCGKCIPKEECCECDNAVPADEESSRVTRSLGRRNKKCAKKCPPNEKWVTTYYTDPTCDQPRKKLSKCVTEYRCIDGYVRHNGKCIKKCDCPIRCPKNEHWAYTNLSDPTCKKKATELCHWVHACRCDAGYVRHNGICIKKCDCPCH